MSGDTNTLRWKRQSSVVIHEHLLDKLHIVSKAELTGRTHTSGYAGLGSCQQSVAGRTARTGKRTLAAQPGDSDCTEAWTSGSPAAAGLAFCA